MKIKYSIIPLMILFLLSIVTAADILITDEVVLNKDYGDVKINEGEATISQDYSGTIEFVENGGEIKFENGITHRFTKGSVIIKDGDIDSIIEADIIKFEIPISYKGEEIDSKSTSILLDGRGINYNSNTNTFSTKELLGISQDGKNHKKIVPETGKKVELTFKGEDSSIPIINSLNNFVHISDDKGQIGLFMGEILFNSFLFSPEGVKTLLIPFSNNHYISIGYEEFGPDFTIAPSEQSKIAEFRLDNGINGEVSGVTFVNHMDKKVLQDQTIFQDRLKGLTSGISFNGDLHIIAKNENKISLSFDDARFQYINQDQINDNSEVNLKITNNLKSDSEILFRKGSPLIKNNINSLDSLIGTKFLAEDGKVWSWEIKKGLINPNVFQNRILFISSPDVGPEVLGKLNNYVDPRTGEIIFQRTPIETNLNLISKPLLLKRNKNDPGVIFDQGLRTHENTIIVPRSFMSSEEFFSALKERNPENEKFDKLIIGSLGKPGEFVLNPISTIGRKLSGLRSELVTIDDLNSLNEIELQSIRNNFKSTATCTAFACYLFSEPGKVGGDIKKSFGAKLTEVLNIPVTGSVPWYNLDIRRDNRRGFHSLKELSSSHLIIAKPGDNGVEFFDEP